MPPAEKKFEAASPCSADFTVGPASGFVCWAGPTHPHHQLVKPYPIRSTQQLEYSDECSRTFVFGDEDHTLGNSLRHVLMGR